MDLTISVQKAVEMRSVSLIDIAPTIARILGIAVSNIDGTPIEDVNGWNCRNAILIIVDSLGLDLYRRLEPDLRHMPAMARSGLLLGGRAVSSHTSPAIASILSGLLPEHHRIYDKESAKRSSIESIPEMASALGLRSAVVMEKNGALVYQGKIEFLRGIPDTLSPADFDREACRRSLEALSEKPRLLVSYFIGIDKTVHLGLGLEEISMVAISIDGYVGEIASAASSETLMVICGDHPVHAGRLKRSKDPYCVALVLSRT